jgi:hypothetical protein
MLKTISYQVNYDNEKLERKDTCRNKNKVSAKFNKKD